MFDYILNNFFSDYRLPNLLFYFVSNPHWK